MTDNQTALAAHLATGTSTVCRCWGLTRKDGVQLGFTDHDEPLEFEGFIFRAEGGLTARALAQSTGLAVDNSEMIGVLSEASVSEADILAGRFDGARIDIWLVNWAEPSERSLRFRGTLGEIEFAGGAFRAEVRGLAEELNVPLGRFFQGPCSAVLGDVRCRVDLTEAGNWLEADLVGVEAGRVLIINEPAGFDVRWFERGQVRILSGGAAGLSGVVKTDRSVRGRRELVLWQEIRAEVKSGDRIRVHAGCDKRAETCSLKFGNFLNFRGFPHLPGEDWQTAYPTRRSVNDGGSLGR